MTLWFPPALAACCFGVLCRPFGRLYSAVFSSVATHHFLQFRNLREVDELFSSAELLYGATLEAVSNFWTRGSWTKERGGFPQTP